jgi:hypothetical protein
MGFCGLDRKRQPLNGDEVRACWQDGAAPLPADPAIPGLLDLLTVQALGHGESVDSPGDASLRSSGDARRSPSGSHRLWVEVEV